MTEGSVWCCNDHRRGNKQKAHNPAVNQVSRYLVTAFSQALYMRPWTKHTGRNFPAFRSSKSLNLCIFFFKKTPEIKKFSSTKIRDCKYLDLHNLQSCTLILLVPTTTYSSISCIFHIWWWAPLIREGDWTKTCKITAVIISIQKRNNFRERKNWRNNHTNVSFLS